MDTDVTCMTSRGRKLTNNLELADVPVYTCTAARATDSVNICLIWRKRPPDRKFKVNSLKWTRPTDGNAGDGWYMQRCVGYL